ncbi:sulfite exporter TauE/SafE family protein [Paenibacillus sp. GCM10012307]|uniref:Probable membrane transporter protein n=1 Tax=Paenibacillus roseus TaxID=2798579 RepID=A0A934J3V3_9BACL|nr:sulfite exporter TauE/SafE family protein [Paenibacillus roseus]MBJ6362789.1 sulfite exporter TauE/SafE family protein [Paenibacillus roseus]
MELYYVSIGCFVGLMVGLTGVGGASLLTPLLISSGIQPTMAVATDLFYNSITKLFGSIQHIRQRTVNLLLVAYFAAGSVPAAILTIIALKYYPPLHAYQDMIITHALGVMLIFIALLQITKLWITDGAPSQLQAKPLYQKKWMTIGIGAALGFVVALTSIGSGSLFALAMMMFYRLRASELIGTDIVHAFLLVSAAGLMHAGMGHVDFALTVNLLIGSIPGVMLGSMLTTRLPAKPLQTLMACVILFSGIKLL